MHIDRNHPVASILSEAALGREPTRAQLDAALNRDDLPDGSDLARFRRRIAAAAEEVARTHTPAPGIADHAAAKAQADDHLGRIAREMTDAERAVTGSNPASRESVDDIAARMFGRN